VVSPWSHCTQEGATLRLAGAITGLFVVVEMLLLQKLVKLIPQAVFSGITAMGSRRTQDLFVESYLYL
jgi:MFS superfamily sulfate permease-like transporter